MAYESVDEKAYCEADDSVVERDFDAVVVKEIR